LPFFGAGLLFLPDGLPFGAGLLFLPDGPRLGGAELDGLGVVGGDCFGGAGGAAGWGAAAGFGGAGGGGADDGGGGGGGVGLLPSSAMISNVGESGSL